MEQNRERRVLISGASGLVGTELLTVLRKSGYSCRTLVRDPALISTDAFLWNPASGEIDTDALEGVEAVVHLSGENVASGWWTKQKKKSLWDSRVDSTRTIVKAMNSRSAPPAVLVSASGLNLYGSSGDTWLDENSPKGKGFLAELAEAWEGEALEAEASGTRVVCLRISMVLSKKGGALGKMLLPFRLGVGGIVGDGSQYVSWISLHDLVRVIIHSIETRSLEGPLNVCSPHSVTNREFTKALASALHRPAFIPLPKVIAQTVLGEMGQELLVASVRGRPSKLLDSGFEFLHPELQQALEFVLRESS